MSFPEKLGTITHPPVLIKETAATRFGVPSAWRSVIAVRSSTHWGVSSTRERSEDRVGGASEPARLEGASRSATTSPSRSVVLAVCRPADRGLRMRNRPALRQADAAAVPEAFTKTDRGLSLVDGTDYLQTTLQQASSAARRPSSAALNRAEIFAIAAGSIHRPSGAEVNSYGLSALGTK